MSNNINPLNTMKDLQKNGFSEDFIFINGKIRNTITKKEYTSAQVEILEEFRFEGISNPSDMSILYAIRTDDGSKGQILASFSPASGNNEIHEFMMASDKMHKSPD